MFHPQPLDWEVVESHAVAPVQVVFKEDGVKVRQIAPNAISGSYTFDLHPPCRTSPPSSPRPKSAAEAGRPTPVSDPSVSMTESASKAPGSPKKLHRKSPSAASAPTAVSNPFTFGILRRTTPPAITPSKEGSVAVGAPEPKPEHRRSLGATFSFLQPRHGRDRSTSPSSPSSTKSGPSTGGSEDGGVMEPASGSGILESELVPATGKEKQAQAGTAPMRHSAGSYFAIVRSKPPSASNNNPTAPVAVGPASPPTLTQPSYSKTQKKKVLKHARAELMKEVGKAGYNVLVVEGWELTVFRQHERYRIKVVYRARPAIAQSDSVEGEGMRLPCSPPYLSVLDD